MIGFHLLIRLYLTLITHPGLAAYRLGEPNRRPEPDQAPQQVVLPSRTILVAAGTQPNTVLGREDPANIAVDGRHFRRSTRTATR